MNKAGLVDRIAAATAISKTQATAAIETFISSVFFDLEKRREVTLVGFGTFCISQHKARNGRNPQTGALIEIVARRVASLRRALS